MEKKYKFTKKCICCGKEFQTNSPQKLYCDGVHYLPCPICGKPVLKKDRDFTIPPRACSLECRQKLLQKNMAPVKCVICGEEFKPKSGRALICDKEHHINCSICGKDMILTKKMYHDGIDTCSDECAREKLRRFYQDKYGVNHPMQCEAVQEHHKAAMKDKYGVEHALQSSISLQKASDTMLKKFGVPWAQQSAEIKQKSYETMERKYGAKTTFESDLLQQKISVTNLNKYGVRNPIQSDEIKAKAQNTCLKRYGATNAMQNPEVYQKVRASRIANNGAYTTQEIKDKIAETNLQRYGVPCVFQSDKIKDKIQQTNLSKYGVKYPAQSASIQSKMHATMVERYGYPFFAQSPEFKQKYDKISSINKAFSSLLTSNDIDHEFEFPIGLKSYDIKVSDALIEIDPSYSHTCDDSINHWHNGLDQFYHIGKSRIAQEAGYRCIHVFDWDDWDRIIQLLKPKNKIYARKCYLDKVDQKTANIFTERYHLQGKCAGQKDNWGLFYQGELVEIMTFGKPRYAKKFDYELLRLCSKDDVKVIGGASRLLKAFRNEHPDSSIISYCDLAKFTGQVYETIGMKLDHISAPAKVWSKGQEYITDNLLRQRGYDQLFNASYGKGTSNEELMLEHGWVPVYDCGQAIYMI